MELKRNKGASGACAKLPHLGLVGFIGWGLGVLAHSREGRQTAAYPCAVESHEFSEVYYSNAKYII